MLGSAPTGPRSGDPAAIVGPQPEPSGTTRIWVLPNPSGLNAHYPLDRLTIEFARLYAAVAPDR